MHKQTRPNTVIAVLMLVAIVMLNTVFAGILDFYSTWYAWLVYGLGALLVFLSMRFQRRLSSAATFGMLAVPLLLALVGAALGI